MESRRRKEKEQRAVLCSVCLIIIIIQISNCKLITLLTASRNNHLKFTSNVRSIEF